MLHLLFSCGVQTNIYIMINKHSWTKLAGKNGAYDEEEKADAYAAKDSVLGGILFSMFEIKNILINP